MLMPAHDYNEQVKSSCLLGDLLFRLVVSRSLPSLDQLIASRYSASSPTNDGGNPRRSLAAAGPSGIMTRDKRLEHFLIRKIGIRPWKMIRYSHRGTLRETNSSRTPSMMYPRTDPVPAPIAVASPFGSGVRGAFIRDARRA